MAQKVGDKQTTENQTQCDKEVKKQSSVIIINATFCENLLADFSIVSTFTLRVK